TISPTYGVASGDQGKNLPEAGQLQPGDGSFQDQVERFEARLIAQALEGADSVRGAARKLQMDPATFLRRKKKYEARGWLNPGPVQE
ncbi:MAG: helix-turn-helix domain-containing protein, partial [Evtepia sp.]